jgi:hypothetical protein
VLLQLNPPLYLTTPKGTALAHFIVDYGPEADIIWGCFQEDTGQIWWWSNPKVRAIKNITMDRINPELADNAT